MKLYENIIIGNFLYALGWKIGASNQMNFSSSVNLLQQTPCDKGMGDLLLEFPGIVRLIEFKDAKASKTKEQVKQKMIRMGLSNLRLEEQKMLMDQVSRRIHWYIETEVVDEECVCDILPYLDAFSDAPRNNLTLESFIEMLVLDVQNQTDNFRMQDYRDYFDIIAYVQGTPKESSSSTSSGLVLIFSEDGSFRYVDFSCMKDFSLQHREYVVEMEKRMKSIMSSRTKIDRNKKNKDYSNSMQIDLHL